MGSSDPPLCAICETFICAGDGIVLFTCLTVYGEGEDDVHLEVTEFDDGDKEKYLHSECVEECFPGAADPAQGSCAICARALDEFAVAYAFQLGEVVQHGDEYELEMGETAVVCAACVEEGIESWADDGDEVTVQRVLGTGLYSEYVGC